MLSTKDKIKIATKQLFPTGRSFRIISNSVKDKFFDATSTVEAEAYDDSLSIFDSMFPDNDNFSEEDATAWEIRLGMIVNQGINLEDRKASIIRKLNYPGTITARQSAGFLQGSLQLANFNVFIHENIPTQSIESILNSSIDITEMGVSEMGDGSEMGSSVDYYSDLFECAEMGVLEMGDGSEMGGCRYLNVIANFINELSDESFSLSQDLKNVFFVGGSDLGTFADIDINRKDEFRQLILRIKPIKSVAVLFINYV